MFKLQFCILLVMYVHNSSCVIDRLYETGKHLWVLYTLVDEMNLTKNHEASDVYDHFSNSLLMSGDVKFQMDEIHKRLTKIDHFSNPKIIGDLFPSAESDPMITTNINAIELSIKSIDDTYDEFHRHMNRDVPHTEAILENLTRRVIVNVKGKIEVIRRILTDGQDFLPDNQTLLSAIYTEAIRYGDVMCDNPKTVAHALVQIFTIVMIAELKCNVMLLFVDSYRYSGKEGWKAMNRLSRGQFEKQFATYTLAFMQNMYMADFIYLRRCDPPGIWLRDVHFVELEGALQSTIFHYDREKCQNYNCNDMWNHYSGYCSAKVYDTRTSCSGKISGCARLDSIDACALTDGPRKFQYVNSTLGFFGKHSKCPEHAGYEIKEWKTDRAVCSCDCSTNHNKVSIVLAESDALLNKVIVGLRFVRRDNTLYIQVREGLLQANGFVAVESCDPHGWVPLPKMTEGSYETFDENANSFFLDDLWLPPDHVLIGVKFNKVKRGSITGFAMEIFGTKFNYKSGRMYAIFTMDRYSSKSTINTGKELEFTRKSSDQIGVPHKVGDSMYVTLKRSDLTDDFGQTTLPFFDILPVITDPPSALGGVGLFHKGVEGYAGFLSLRVYSINYVNYFIEFNNKKVHNGKALFNLTHEEEDPNDPLIQFNRVYRIRDD